VNLTDPMSSVLPSVHGTVLAVLARTSTPLTGRRVAELASSPASQRQVANVLTALTEAGVVLREAQGPANLYVLNRDHLACSAIESLASLRDQLWARMRADVSCWRPAPHAVAVFGSAARGEGNSMSDIDVLVIRHHEIDADDRDWQDNLASFADRVHRWSGNSCEILEHTPGSLQALAHSGERIVTELRRDAVFLFGSVRALPVPPRGHP
jgi:predicted nucleotidyltransferase